VTLPSPVPRAAAPGRPSSDPACAGCAHLGTYRALRKAGLEVQGGLGCEPEAEAPFAPGWGRWAAVTGLDRLAREGAAALLEEAGRAGARVVVVADRVAAVRTTQVETELVRAGARVVVLQPADLAGAEERVREALDHPGTVLVALVPCALDARRTLPFAVDPARCNRCGSCLTLACPAITDPGGESMVVDAATCPGCGLCAPLCRSRALGPIG
jgi:Pyruvate/2-oxoacid:ferredoxin oxidoreductase delta subunit